MAGDMGTIGNETGGSSVVLNVPQRTPGTLWVAVILTVVGIAQVLIPDANYAVIAAVVLAGNFTVGLAELYAPMFSGTTTTTAAMHDSEDVTVRVPLRQVWHDEPAPAGMLHETAVMKLLIGG